MKESVKNNILKKIGSGEVKMRSRIEVLGEKLGISGGVILLFAGLIIISGLVSYWFKYNSDLIFGGYGRYGLRIFAQTFPYVFLVSFFILFLILSLILRRFDFSYKKPFILIISAIIGVVLVLGWFSLKTPYGRSFYQNSGRFFGIGRMISGTNMVMGEVTKIDGNTIILRALEEEESKAITIQTSSNTHYPFGIPQAGDIIRSVGRWNDNKFEAVGIRVFSSDDDYRMRGGFGRGMMMNGQGKRQRWTK